MYSETERATPSSKQSGAHFFIHGFPSNTTVLSTAVIAILEKLSFGVQQARPLTTNPAPSVGCTAYNLWTTPE